MEDFIGKEIELRDIVVCNTPYSHTLKLGMVIDIIESKAIIKMFNTRTKQYIKEISRLSEQIVKI